MLHLGYPLYAPTSNKSFKSDLNVKSFVII